MIVGIQYDAKTKLYTKFMYFTGVGAVGGNKAFSTSIEDAAFWGTQAKAMAATKKLKSAFKTKYVAFFVVTQNASKANIETIIERYGFRRKGKK